MHVVHVTEKAIHLGRHPEETREAEFQKIVGDEQLAALKSAAYLEMARDVNEQYAREISVLGAHVTELGFPAPRVTVMDDEDFDSIPGFNKIEGYGGTVLRGRVAVRNGRQGFANQQEFVSRVIAHEVAHALGEREEVLITTGYDANEPEKFHFGHIDNANPFIKMKASRGKEVSVQGKLLEEGFAELQGMAMREATGLGPSEEYVQRVEEGVKRAVEEGYMSPRVSPIRYSIFCVDEIEGLKWISGDNGNAAYAVDLLREKAPDLLDDMLQARREPGHYRKVVESIERIEKGLYRKLRENPYNGASAQGVELVKNALRKHSRTVVI